MKTRAYRVFCAIMNGDASTLPVWEGDVIVYARDIDRVHDIARRVCERFYCWKWGMWVVTRSISLAEDKIPLSIEEREPVSDKPDVTRRRCFRHVSSICADLSTRLKNSDFSYESDGMGVLVRHSLKEDETRLTIPELLGCDLWRVGVVAMKGSNEGYYVEALALGNVTKPGDPKRPAVEIFTVKMLTTFEEANDLAAFLQTCFDEA
jgi:hypothetical protein